MASRNDVAKLAGVSPSVVSYVLNDSNYVSKEKREAVLRAVKELNYQPSYFGRALKEKRTNNLALICDDIRGELFTEIAFYIEAAVYRRGYNLFLSNSHRRQSFLQELASRKFDGIFIATSVYGEEEISYLAESGTPIALYEARSYENLDPRVSLIRVDYERGAALLAERMIGAGFRKIAFFPPYQSKLKEIREKDYRFRGYLTALSEHGIEPDESLICFENDDYDGILCRAEAICRAAAEEREKIGFIVGSDYLAVQIMNRLTDCGLYEQGRVAVAGMDHTRCSQLVRPVLTTIGFSKEDIAKSVVRFLLPREEERERSGQSLVLIPTVLVEGTSG